MKKIVYIIILVFSLLVIKEDVYQCERIEDSNFQKIERLIKEETVFINNGVKLEYTTTGSSKDEIRRIYNLLMEDSSLSLYKEKDKIVATNNHLEYNIKAYIENSLVKVEVIILNKDKNISTDKMKTLAQKVKNDKFIDERYFFIAKGKIITREGFNTVIPSNYSGIKHSDYVSINNGDVYKLKFNNGENINASFVTYDTGTYVIIGTPVIFLTY